MADFTTPDLQGANETLNKALNDATKLKDSFLANHGAEASSILSSLSALVNDLVSSFKSLIPELPSIPNINAQSDFTQLANLDITTTQGLAQFEAQKATLESQFGDAFKDKGLDFDDLANQMQAAGDDATSKAAELIPNFQIPAGETEVLELPANVSLASNEAIKEAMSKIEKDTVTLVTTEYKVKEVDGKITEVVSSTTETITETKPKYITSTSTNEQIKISDTGGESKLMSASTRDKLIKEKAERKKLERKLAQRTIIPGTFVSERGETLPIQKYTDRFIELREKKVNDPIGYPDLGIAKVRKWFDSETDDEGGRTEESFQFAREVGDWNWRDDGEYIIYDRRYKKNRKIT